jgi:hypothetical protein
MRGKPHKQWNVESWVWFSFRNFSLWRFGNRVEILYWFGFFLLTGPCFLLHIHRNGFGLCFWSWHWLWLWLLKHEDYKIWNWFQQSDRDRGLEMGSTGIIFLLEIGSYSYLEWKLVWWKNGRLVWWKHPYPTHFRTMANSGCELFKEDSMRSLARRKFLFCL